MTADCAVVMMARAEKVCGKERRSPVGRVSKARMVKEGTLAVLTGRWETGVAHRKSSHAPCVITSAALCPAGHCFPAGTSDSSTFQSGSLTFPLLLYFHINIYDYCFLIYDTTVAIYGRQPISLCILQAILGPTWLQVAPIPREAKVGLILAIQNKIQLVKCCTFFRLRPDAERQSV